MKVTKTMEIEFPWTLENDGHSWTRIYELKDVNDEPTGTYNYENRFSNHKLCEQKEMTTKEVQELMNSCYEIARRTDF